MAKPKSAKKMQKHQEGTVKASIFMSPDLNERVKLAAGREAQRTGARISGSTYVVKILEKHVPAIG